MTALDAHSDFAAFFEAVHGFEPFPWQQRLAEEASADQWPGALSLPTASGKTAILDIAIFALAARAGDAPRRIFMTVDRRLVVDQAHRHAERLRDALHEARDGVVKRVADRLRALAGGEDDRDAWPLLVARLRGGLPDERLWCRSPLQPTIVSTTVDQIGSRVLFRGYGVAPRAWPIHAGLVGCDSLVILDEAHCSEPFRQTLAAIRREQERGGEVRSGMRPIQTVELSATPRSEGRSLALTEADRSHPVLGRRLRATKAIELAIVKGPLADPSSPPDAKDSLANEIADRLEVVFAADGEGATPPIRVAVVVNRVDRAKRTASLLRDRLGKAVDVRLMIGAMRPIDRDRLDAELRERVGPNAMSSAPLVVVATQCLEVGADLDFDRMLSELAPLDALRQRFGRLNRTGRAIEASGVVLAAESRLRKPATDSNPDPLYGTADVAAWELLDRIATAVELPQRRGKPRVVRRCDFGIESLDRELAAAAPAQLAAARTPADDAPCLLPGHVDAFAQTNPAPAAEPEPSLYLHGTRADSAEISICFRSDLPDPPDHDASDEGLEEHAEILAAYHDLLPPVQRECLSVRLPVARRWWADEAADDADVPIAEESDERDASRREPRERRGPVAVLVSGRGDPPRWLRSPAELRPGDTLLVPVTAIDRDDAASRQQARLGHVPSEDGWPSLDRADEAWNSGRRAPRVRIHPATLRAIAEAIGVELPRDLASAASEVWNADGEGDWVEPLRDWLHAVDATSEVAAALWPAFARDAIALLRDALEAPRARLMPHPVCGVIVTARARKQRSIATPPPLVLPDELTPGTATLADHSEGVASLAERFARALSTDRHLHDAMRDAGLWHDLGKADPRFQALLRGGAGFGELLAKSPRQVIADPAMRRRSGWPRGGRHEAVSLAAIEASSLLDADRDWLALHLVATHHGSARPFLPTFAAPLDSIDATLHGRELSIDADAMQLPDARIAERYWRAIETYGPWGTAFLEAIFRLADARRSEAEDEASTGVEARPREVVR